MKIRTSAISREFTDAYNIEALRSPIQEKIREGEISGSEVSGEVSLSLNLLDPDIYSYEYSDKEKMLCITRRGTSLTEDTKVIGSTGFVDIENSYHNFEEAIRDILGINKKELTGYAMNGRKVQITVSKGWWMTQDENEDIFMKAFADVNASHVWSEDDTLNGKIRALNDIQGYIREYKTKNPMLKLGATLCDDLDTMVLSVDGSDFGLYEDENMTLQIALAIIKGYKTAMEH